jgi:hypothetical protein
MVLNLIGIEIHAFYRSPRSPVVIGADRVVQQKFGPSLGSVDFDGNHGRRSNQDSVLSLLRDHEGTLFDSEAAAKFGRQHHSAAPAYSAGQYIHKRQNS